ncbi:NAD(P)/FAD-dependent oxidoreductase [Roseococcus sp. SDR]|uniref:NAD(P)/FAD-dependent oxidoreductase n=1 Tax=Roseococcus sp. SDR TaxID=2835532 RepID=UPI001BD0408A|nr:NAD(P)/FAD-dependent oxidoreductase [Roseococcus sp. SDR]MBS7789006.1 NAD(P)/FAD-dependent oxidoreductase [Roseococcus sp. SDR]MBV1844320.1 NAD(P)/FAD-dependent oxidoreductase [Roseococcus sp. SDR]
MADPHRIVIVGGGAGGLELATRLGNRYGKGQRARVTLVERSRTHLWKPLLHAVAAGSLDRAQHELNYLAQAHWHHFTYRYGEMVGLDREAKEVLLGAMLDEEGREITPASRVGYDTLVISVGSVTNDFGTPGAAQHAIPLETLDQASRFNRRLVNACLRANAQPEPVRPGQLHVAIIGAGATGTELAAELHRTVRAVVAYGLDRIEPERDIRIMLVEAAPRILPALPERISAATSDLLAKMGVEVHVGTRVAEVRADGVVLADGGFLPAELTVWAAGVKGADFLKEIGGLETNRINQLKVLPTLQTTRDPSVFALGDCASCPREGSEQPIPPRAQAAHQQASHMYNQIERILDGKPLEPFVYRDFGSLVSLGKYSTVGSLMGFLVGKSMFIEGYFARLMYRSLYKMHQTALHGSAPTAWRSLASLVSQRAEPGVKLH